MLACQVLLVTLIIEVAGGLPSQLAHLYYVPIVIAAGTLSRRDSLAVALFTGLCVSPAIDGVHSLLGRDAYYSDPAFWNVSEDGWIARPLAFVLISLIVARLMQEYMRTLSERTVNASRAQEIKVLSLIDKMILSGTSEEDSIKEISRFAIEFNNAFMGGIAMPDHTSPRTVTFRGFYRSAEGLQEVTNPAIPYGEGVVGWALMHGRTSWSRNVFADPRYHLIAEMARARGWIATAAAAIVLEGEILGALVIGHDREHDFTPDELEAIERTADQAALAISNARQRDALQRMALDTATVLSSVIETRDAYTADHCERMVDYAGLTAASLALPPKEIELVKLGAALHDVGKIVVPDHILRKPERLTPDEYAIIKQHCYHGGQICKKVPFLEPVHKLVYHHHERFDGAGYPDGLSGEAIPIGARIIAVTDAYDAMTSDRPYRRSLGFAAAGDRLKAGSGTQWDPRVIAAFLESVRASEHHAHVA
jgi:HD-GYP domain-containing protein (c-di-GMP phosphodiesterase class II)